MTASDIILRLGGARRVAEIVGVTRNAVAQWYRIGIPAKYWPALSRETNESGDAFVTLEELEAHTAPLRNAPRRSETFPASAEQDAA